MRIRNIRKSDYEAVDRLLLQINQVDVEGRPDLFVPIVQYMPRETFESLVENDNVIAILAQHRGEIIGCCFVSMLGRSGMIQFVVKRMGAGMSSNSDCWFCQAVPKFPLRCE